MARKCPYCDEGSGDKAEYNRHVTGHLIEKLKTSYPGLIDTIEKVESEMPVKFILKIDMAKVVAEDKLMQNILTEMDKESEG